MYQLSQILKLLGNGFNNIYYRLHMEMQTSMHRAKYNAKERSRMQTGNKCKSSKLNPRPSRIPSSHTMLAYQLSQKL